MSFATKSASFGTLFPNDLNENSLESENLISVKSVKFVQKHQLNKNLFSNSLNNDSINADSDQFCSSLKKFDVIDTDLNELQFSMKNSGDLNHQNIDSFSEDFEQVEVLKINAGDNQSDTEKKNSANVHNLIEEKSESEAFSVMEKKGSRSKILVSKNDPLSRLHFIKFMKKGGKTVKIVECGICGKEFFQKYTLMRHLTIHTNERDFKCTICGKAFKQRSTLSQHQSTHYSIRPYVCEICQKTFTRVTALMCHKRIHSLKKRHVCEICGKAFHQKVNLKNHYFTHTNERPYKCDICDRGFNQLANVQAHKLKNHLSKGKTERNNVSNRFKCSFCDEMFPRKALLQRHQDVFHFPPASESTSGKSKISPKLIRKLKTFSNPKKKLGDIEILPMPSEDIYDEPKFEICIDPIDTEEMRTALSHGRVPFALLKPNDKPPVVVEIRRSNGNEHVLVPVLPSSLFEYGQAISINEDLERSLLHLKISIVAIIHQKYCEKGKIIFEVESPSSKYDSSSILQQNLCDSGIYIDSDVANCGASFLTNSETNRIKSELVSVESKPNECHIIPLVLPTSLDQHEIEYVVPPQNDEQLVEIEPSGDGSSQLLSNDMQLRSFTIHKDENWNCKRTADDSNDCQITSESETSSSNASVSQQLKIHIDEMNSMSVDASNLAALVRVLQSAGYQLQTDSPEKIIIEHPQDSDTSNKSPERFVIEDSNSFTEVENSDIDFK